ncbi:type II toxin-antitoxin system YhaV family toxin [Azospirillum formosense]|nr:type II toxin-antitoxin system YhaV family toxin [Azospirillum formosense]MBY3755748.1 toxin YhaV [Azospirillum formosense]
MSNSPFDTRHGWQLYMHPAFKGRYDTLVDSVERLKVADAEGYVSHPQAKLLKRINELILDEIPSKPGDPKYRQGKTLGSAYKDWFRAKFFSRFRLFFRYSTDQRIIIFCWLNDENTLRQAGSDTDPYAVFAKMIRAGNPPNDWEELIKVVVGETKKV